MEEWGGGMTVDCSTCHQEFSCQLEGVLSPGRKLKYYWTVLTSTTGSDVMVSLLLLFLKVRIGIPKLA